MFDVSKIQTQGKALADKFARAIEVCAKHPYQDISPLVCLFNHEGKPITLDNHVFFKPWFKLRRPEKRLLKCGRQVGKSFSDLLSAVQTQCMVPGYRHLFVTPLHSQVIRLSKEYYAPFLKTSAFAPLMIKPGVTDDNELHRSLANNSHAYFSYAFNNVDRVRGFANIHEVTIDEVQDMIADFIPIIGQTMSATVGRGFFTYSGTPKTFDNTIQKLWDDESSQGEWETKCHGCGKWNRASIGADLLKMIGKETVICAKCGKPLDPVVDGQWVHAFPSRLDTFESLHVSQIIHPYHYRHYSKWRKVLAAMNGDVALFYNEVLGESKDSASRLVTLDDLRTAGTLGANTDDNALKNLKGCNRIILAIDWGGGGEGGKSTTAVAVLGQKPHDDTIQCVRLIRLPRSLTPERELVRIVDLFKQFGCHALAHDHGGGGNVREAMLVEAGMPRTKIAPFEYGWFPNGPVVRQRVAVSGSRSTYQLDKSRSLYVVAQMIRSRKILFPNVDSCKDEIYDFLSLTEEPLKRPMSGDRKFVGKARGGLDDIAHAVNFGCSSLWWMSGSYPKITLPTQYTVESDEWESEADQIQMG